MLKTKCGISGMPENSTATRQHRRFKVWIKEE
jgi:hypothetical protein